MITDQDIMADIRPDLATDKVVIRNVDGNAKLQRIMRQLPEHWRLEHLAAIGHGVLTVVFSRDPSKSTAGDFDYFAPEV